MRRRANGSFQLGRSKKQLNTRISSEQAPESSTCQAPRVHSFQVAHLRYPRICMIVRRQLGADRVSFDLSQGEPRWLHARTRTRRHAHAQARARAHQMPSSLHALTLSSLHEEQTRTSERSSAPARRRGCARP
eukprot:6185413-Pleurochrysis_carterae.AAC.4